MTYCIYNVTHEVIYRELADRLNSSLVVECAQWTNHLACCVRMTEP